MIQVEKKVPMVISIPLNSVIRVAFCVLIRHLCAVLVAGVTSEGQSDPSVAGTSQALSHEEEEGREAEAAATKGNDLKTNLPSPTTINTARRSASGRIGRARGTRVNASWSNNSPRGGMRPNMDSGQGENYDP